MAKDDPAQTDRRARRRQKWRDAAAAPDAPPTRLDPLTHLGDIDAWNLRQDGAWLRFDARIEDTPRAYLRPLAPEGHIIADAPGPLIGLFGIGGARHAGFNIGPAAFRYNVFAPADHIGAVGLEGSAPATRQPGLHHIAHRSRQALIADRLLALRHDARRGLPLMMVRAETDASATLDALGTGIAYQNLLIAFDNLIDTAARLGRRAEVLAVTLDFGAEDTTAPAEALVTGHLALMSRLTAALRQRGLPPPIYLMTAETGTARLSDHPAIRAAWALAWATAGHRILIAAPGYAGEQDRLGRLTEAGRAHLAALEAHALDAIAKGEAWSCPLPLLAEHQGAQIRVTFRALTDLVLDPRDPFAAGPAMGFRITGTDTPVAITRVAPAPDDPRALILSLDGPITGPAPRLHHACNLAPAADTQPANRSAIRDLWQQGALYRWALPADLPLHPAAKGNAT